LLLDAVYAAPLDAASLGCCLALCLLRRLTLRHWVAAWRCVCCTA